MKLLQVFQRRYDGREDFNTRWMDYRLGFGRLGTEFWLGNEHLHHITMQADYLLRVDLEDFNGKKAWATYVDFRVGTETQNYRLHIGNFTGGKAGMLLLHVYPPIVPSTLVVLKPTLYFAVEVLQFGNTH